MKKRVFLLLLLLGLTGCGTKQVNITPKSAATTAEQAAAPTVTAVSSAETAESTLDEAWGMAVSALPLRESNGEAEGLWAFLQDAVDGKCAEFLMGRGDKVVQLRFDGDTYRVMEDGVSNDYTALTVRYDEAADETTWVLSEPSADYAQDLRLDEVPLLVAPGDRRQTLQPQGLSQHGRTFDEAEMTAFLQSSQSGQAASVTISRKNLEGQDVTITVRYDGAVFSVTEDTAGTVEQNYFSALSAHYRSWDDMTEWYLGDPTAGYSQTRPLGALILKYDAGNTSGNSETLWGTGDEGTYYVRSLDFEWNPEVVEAFLSAVQSGENASVRMISYTVEGDAILTEVVHESGRFFVTMDNTRDRYSNRTVETLCFQSLVTEYDEETDETYWLLRDDLDGPAVYLYEKAGNHLDEEQP